VAVVPLPGADAAAEGAAGLRLFGILPVEPAALDPLRPGQAAPVPHQPRARLGFAAADQLVGIEPRIRGAKVARRRGLGRLGERGGGGEGDRDQGKRLHISSDEPAPFYPAAAPEHKRRKHFALALAHMPAIVGAMRRLLLFAVACCLAAPACGQELPSGQSEADYHAWLAANPGNQGQMLSFEAWQRAAGVGGVLPTWQLIRTASMWRECGGAPFEIPPFRLWPGMAATLKFVRDHVRPAVGPVEAVSGYRNAALNACARGSERSAHLDFFALDLVPLQPTTRRQLFERLCPMHARDGPAAGVGLGFYSFTRFHIDTRSFRRWGSAGPEGNESPCAVLERGGDPEAPPLPRPEPAAPVIPPPAPPPTQPQPQPQ